MERKVTVRCTPLFTALVVISAVIFSFSNVVGGTTDPSDGKALIYFLFVVNLEMSNVI